jgi:hypothetical protein
MKFLKPHQGQSCIDTCHFTRSQRVNFFERCLVLAIFHIRQHTSRPDNFFPAMLSSNNFDLHLQTLPSTWELLQQKANASGKAWNPEGRREYFNEQVTASARGEYGHCGEENYALYKNRNKTVVLFD